MSLKKIAITKDSTIFFEKDPFSNLNAYLKKKKFSKIFVLVDNNTFENCYPILAESCSLLHTAEIIEVESGEQNKTLNTCSEIWEGLSEINADKHSLLINLGGGVITDLGGFIASIYKRGISFIHIPTTLLAMADASVGGKCGVNLRSVKNQLGTITQPDAVFIYTPFLGTLDTRHLKNGMAEIVKMALISDKKLMIDLHDGKKQLEEIIFKSVTLKAAIVRKDPFDKGLRKTLNFGHTIGHAIESTLLGTKQELLHGEAIAIGMIIEAFICMDKKLISKTDLTALINLIQPNYKLIKFSKAQAKTIFEFIQHDKKNKGKTIRMSLLKGLGACLFDQEVTLTQIEKAFVNYTTLIAS